MARIPLDPARFDGTFQRAHEAVSRQAQTMKDLDEARTVVRRKVRKQSERPSIAPERRKFGEC